MGRDVFMMYLALSHTSEMTPVSRELDPLVEACRAGRPGAWRALYEANFDFAWRTARRLGLPEVDVEDAVQDAFHIAWKQLPQLKWGRFSTWFYRIIANVVSARLRHMKVRDLLGGLWSDASSALATGGADQLEARQALGVVERALRRMSREKREAFVLFEIEGCTHQEIAELTQAKIETVRTRVFYARKEFERVMAQLEVKP